MYKFGILTSLYDDDAPQLLETLNRAIENGQIEAEVPVVFCDRREEKNPEVDARIRHVRRLTHMENLVFLPPSSVRYADGEDRRLVYDRAAAEILSDSGASSFLNIGYMRIMTPLLHGPFNVVNLHPALPEIGPIGKWDDVMKEQAERPLEGLAQACSTEAEISSIMHNRYNKAGGMLHLVSEKLDRGSVISWYEFPLTSPRLTKLWTRVAGDAKQYGIEAAKAKPYFGMLAAEIRREQVQGEHPLLVLTYSNLSRGNWSIKDKVLYAGNEPQAGGVCMTSEVGRHLRSAGIETAIR